MKRRQRRRPVTSKTPKAPKAKRARVTLDTRLERYTWRVFLYNLAFDLVLAGLFLLALAACNLLTFN